MAEDNPSESRIETRAVTAGEHPDRYRSGDVVQPIHLSSTYVQPEVQSSSDFEFTYARSGSPTRSALEERIASLANADYALACSAGMGAIGTLTLGVLEPGDQVVASAYLYGGTRKLFDQLLAAKFGINIEYVDPTDLDNVEAAIGMETDLVWMESPTNPLMKLCDIAAIADLAAANNAVFGVDNTFMSPYFQRPLDHGADVVVHSTTKYLNGHSDGLGGVILTNDEGIYEEATFMYQYGTGTVMGPVDAYLVLRGTKTLHTRMKQHEQNATAIATTLEEHSAVTDVYYPGLETHPQHVLAREQMDGFGGMVSFEIDGGFDAVKRFLESLDHFHLAASLGGVESLIAHPETMTHYYLDEPTREAMGISTSLIRLSTGIEHNDDLITDLETGLAQI